MKYRFLLFFFTLFMASGSIMAQVQKINTIAGTGAIGFSGDGGTAPVALFNSPLHITLDAAGNIYVQDKGNYRIRKIFTSGYITTVVGNGVPLSGGDGSVATSAGVSPSGMAVSPRGEIYVADDNAHVIRKVDTFGIITTFAGTNGLPGYTGDGGAATSAKMRNPTGLAVDNKGNLFIAEAGNHVIREIDTAGKIHTVAGAGVSGYFGDGGPATAALIDSALAIAVDTRGNLYISDYFNNVIRRVDTAHIITTIAGTGVYGYSGDGFAATAATLNEPKGIIVDANRNVYFSDCSNNVIRKVDTFGNITTVVGNGTPAFGGDLGPVNGANLHSPFGVAIDNNGNIYIADANNQRIRKTYSPTGVNHMTPLIELDVYPNPFANNITVKGLSVSDKVCLYDITGKQASEVWEVKNEGKEIFTVNGLPSGPYMMHIWDSEGNKKASLPLIKE